MKAIFNNSNIVSNSLFEIVFKNEIENQDIKIKFDIDKVIFDISLKVYERFLNVINYLEGKNPVIALTELIKNPGAEKQISPG